MVSRDDRAIETTGANPTGPTGQEAMITSLDVNLVVTPEAPLLADLADTDDEKAHQDAFQLIMQGFHTATRTFSDEYQETCKEVQSIVWKSICQWVIAVHPAMDCMGESLEKQSRLLQAARQAGKEATEDILALLPAKESPFLTPVVPWEDILTPALTATRKHTEKAIEAVNMQLSALVHRHVPPQQAGVFLASLLQVMCSYRQEMDGMATSQVVLLGQIVPNLWVVSRSMMEGLTLLGPPNCLTSWLASLVEQVSADPANKATLVGLTTPVKHNTSGSSKGKLPPGSSGKKSVPPKQVTDYWDHPERDKEDEESQRQEEEKRQKKQRGLVLSLDEHEESVSLLTSKAIPSRVSQAPGLPTCTPSKGKRSQSKVQRASPVWFNSSDNEPLSDKGGKLEPKSRKRDHSTPGSDDCT